MKGFLLVVKGAVPKRLGSATKKGQDCTIRFSGSSKNVVFADDFNSNSLERLTSSGVQQPIN